MASQINTPYASPQTRGRNRQNHLREAFQSPKLSLFSDRQIGVSAFLGTPLAGAIMFAYNAYKLGRSSMALAIIAGTLALTVMLVLVGQILPSPVSQLLLLGVALGMKQMTATTFAEEM